MLALPLLRSRVAWILGAPFPPGAVQTLLLSGAFTYVDTHYDWALNSRR